MPLARRPGIRAPGRAIVTTLRVCQKMPSRPEGSVVKTNWERSSRGRSRTRSMATARRRQRVTGTSSMISASSGQPSSTRAQKTRLVRVQVSRTLRMRPPSIGSWTRYGSRESGSGLRATTKFTPKSYGSRTDVVGTPRSFGRLGSRLVEQSAGSVLIELRDLLPRQADLALEGLGEPQRQRAGGGLRRRTRALSRTLGPQDLPELRLAQPNLADRIALKRPGLIVSSPTAMHGCVGSHRPVASSRGSRARWPGPRPIRRI